MKRQRSTKQTDSPPRWYRGANVPKRVIRCFADEVAKRFQPDKIILFGSHAYGIPHADSDVDILVIMPARNELGQAVRIRLAVDYRFPLDLLVRTPKNLAWRLAEGDCFLKEIIAKGEVLYEKDDPRVGAKSRCWSSPAPQALVTRRRRIDVRGAHLVTMSLFLLMAGVAAAADPPPRMRSDPPPIVSSWDDLLEGVQTREDWQARRQVLKQRFLELIRDERKPVKPPLDLQVHETVDVEGIYRRQLVSYNVEQDERAHAYLGIPLKLDGKAPAIVALHGTTAQGKEQTAGLSGNPDKAWLDQLCRRGYVVIAPDHFVSGHRIPPEGPYDTTRFYQKHPEWTAVGKFTYEHAIAIDVLQSLPEVDPERIGALGHSLGGHGTYFLAAYDERIKASACNCGATFFRHNKRVEEWARDHWYVYLKPMRAGLLEGKLPPIDMHEIIALIAPRPFLDLSGLNDGDSLTQRQRALMLLRIMDVYELEKAPQNFAFHMHGRGHSVAHESRELIFGWMDTHLKPAEATQTRLLTEQTDAPK